MPMNIQPHLDKNSEILIAELKSIINMELPNDVRCIRVLIFREGLPGVPFYIYFLNRFQSSARGIKPIEPLSGLEILVDSDGYIGREEAVVNCLNIEDEEEQDGVYQKLNDLYNSQNLTAAKWFADCWRKAGGEGPKRRVTASILATAVGVAPMPKPQWNSSSIHQSFSIVQVRPKLLYTSFSFRSAPFLANLLPFSANG